MAFFPPQSSAPKKERELIPAKTHEAYCYGVIDLGTQKRPAYLGKPKDPARSLMLLFEFTEVLREFKEGEPPAPAVKNVRYSYFTDEKSGLAKMCNSWLAKPVAEVDFDKLAGTPASVTISHDVSKANGKTYDNITLVAPLSEKLIPLMPPMHNPITNFSIEEHGFDSDNFKNLYEWIQDIIKESEEYQKYLNGPGSIEGTNQGELSPPPPFE